MKIVIGIQARMASSRLPGKVMFPLAKKPILQWVADAAFQMGMVCADWRILCTDEDREIIERFGDQAIAYPAEIPVSERYLRYGADADYVIRLCGDQPHISINRGGVIINRLLAGRGGDYLGYMVDSMPAAVTSYGVFPEAVSIAALRRAEPSDHVTNTIYSRPDLFDCRFFVDDVAGHEDFVLQKPYSLAVDTLLDYYRIRGWTERGGKNPGGDPYKNLGRYEWL